MPNSLAHIGIQSIVSKSLWKDEDAKWFFAGAVLPDTPWIFQRLFLVAFPSEWIAARAYFDVQASLAGCLVLSASLALISSRPTRTFAILATNALLHLLLDAMQTKLGNGVHLFAPVSWELTAWNLFWPESLPSYLMTAAGVVAVGLLAKKSGLAGQQRPEPKKMAYAGTLVAAYFIIPLFLASGPIEADNHGLKLLTSDSHRVGKLIELDRVDCRSQPDCLVRPGLTLVDVPFVTPAKVSVTGRFVSDNEVSVLGFHVHHPWFRDVATYAGLLVVLVVWLRALMSRTKPS